jgi:molecular chaperone HtpG
VASALFDRVDEWMVSNFGEFDGTPLKSIAKGNLEDLEMLFMMNLVI